MQATKNHLVPERTVMIDCGRKYFSPDFFYRLLDLMEELDMTHLQLHFSENEGFRLECETYPEIVSEEHLTKDQVRQIIAYAKERGIQVIPEIDSPGHLQQFLNYHPDWRLRYQGDPDQDWQATNGLDITNPQAVQAVYALYEEYFDLFRESDYFHIGADEFVNFNRVQDFPDLVQASQDRYGPEADGTEVYIDYVNDLIAKIRQEGFIPRVWNDGFYRHNQSGLVQLSPDVEITYWTRWDDNMAPVQKWADLGYSLLNCNDNYFYLVLGEAASYTYPEAEKILEEDWRPHIYSGGQEGPQPRGTYFLVWCDHPQALTQEEVFDRLEGPLRAQQAQVHKEV